MGSSHCFVVGCFVVVFFFLSVDADLIKKNDEGFGLEGVMRQANRDFSARYKEQHRHQERDTEAATCWGGLGSPGPNEQLEGRACCWYAESTCCTQSFGSGVVIAGMLQAIESNLTWILEHGFNSSNDCYLNLADVMCAPCAPNNLFYNIMGPTFSLCSSWCDQIWSSCKGYASIIQLPSNITTSSQFCKLLFSELEDEFLQITTTNCFGGYPIRDLECKGCVPGTKPCTMGNGWKVAVLVVLVLVGVVLAALASVFFYRRWKSRQSSEASFGRGAKFTSFVDEDEAIN